MQPATSSRLLARGGCRTSSASARGCVRRSSPGGRAARGRGWSGGCGPGAGTRGGSARLWRLVRVSDASVWRAAGEGEGREERGECSAGHVWCTRVVGREVAARWRCCAGVAGERRLVDGAAPRGAGRRCGRGRRTAAGKGVREAGRRGGGRRCGGAADGGASSAVLAVATGWWRGVARAARRPAVWPGPANGGSVREWRGGPRGGGGGVAGQRTAAVRRGAACGPGEARCRSPGARESRVVRAEAQQVDFRVPKWRAGARRPREGRVTSTSGFD